MHDKALVTKIENNTVSVVPLIADACMSCQKECSKGGHAFTASNPLGLHLVLGSIVKIKTPAAAGVFQGIFSLLFPVICAVGGYFIANPVAAHYGKTASEEMHAGFVLAGLLISSLFVYFLSRSVIRLTKPEITEVF